MSRNDLLGLAPYLGDYVIGGSFLRGEGYANPLLVTPDIRGRRSGTGPGS